MFLPRFEEGTSRFINGDNTLWKQNASRRDDVKIMPTNFQVVGHLAPPDLFTGLM
jgi:hypothetical protein